jgi:hypothetical protein
MSRLAGRIVRAERVLGPPPGPDPWRDLWQSYRDFVYAVLEQGGHAEALALVRQRVAGNEPHVFPGRGPILRPIAADGTDLYDVRVWVMAGTVRAVLRDHPAARQAVEQALDAEAEPLGT